VYVQQDWTIDAAQVEALRVFSRTVDLAPGSGGSRITPIGAVVLPVGTGRGALVVLYPSCQIVAHCDPPIVGQRYHVPIVTNAGCWVFHGGHWQQLTAGRGYAMNPSEDHGAVNWGAEPRLHLMVDVED
jgi:hypothetical protein